MRRRSFQDVHAGNGTNQLLWKFNWKCWVCTRKSENCRQFDGIEAGGCDSSINQISREMPKLICNLEISWEIARNVDS